MKFNEANILLNHLMPDKNTGSTLILQVILTPILFASHFRSYTTTACRTKKHHGGNLRVILNSRNSLKKHIQLSPPLCPHFKLVFQP